MSDFDIQVPPTPERLDPDVLAAISDDVLEFVLVSYIGDRIRGPDDDEATLLLKLPEALRIWYLTFIVDGDVLNGGFNQLFFNLPIAVLNDAPTAFEKARMPKAAQLMRAALMLLEERAPVIEAAQDDGSVEAFMETYDGDPFQALDVAYGEEQDGFRTSRLGFLRESAHSIRHP